MVQQELIISCQSLMLKAMYDGAILRTSHTRRERIHERFRGATCEDPDGLMKSVTRAGPRSVMDHSDLSAHLTLSLSTTAIPHSRL